MWFSDNTRGEEKVYVYGSVDPHSEPFGIIKNQLETISEASTIKFFSFAMVSGETEILISGHKSPLVASSAFFSSERLAQ